MASVGDQAEERGRDPGPALSLSHTRNVYLCGIFLILLCAALKFSSEIAVPIVAAVLLAFVFLPLQRLLLKLRVPNYASAFVIILMLMGGASWLGSALAGPLASWTAQIPETFPDLKDKLRFLTRPVEKTKALVSQAEDITATGPHVTPVAIQGNRLFDKVVNGTSAAVGEVLTTLLILFFLLGSGEVFMRRLTETLPSYHDKRQLIAILHEIESDVSRYLVTVSFMNILVGAAAGLIMLYFGLDDPVPWALVAFIFNYLTIIGPFMIFLAFLFMGLLKIGVVWAGFVPAALFLGVHILEADLVTPRLLARRFTINPLVVILWLLFWYWMWGFAGAFLSVPMIVVAKIICSRVERFKAFGHIVEG